MARLSVAPFLAQEDRRRTVAIFEPNSDTEDQGHSTDDNHGHEGSIHALLSPQAYRTSISSLADSSASDSDLEHLATPTRSQRTPRAIRSSAQRSAQHPSKSRLPPRFQQQRHVSSSSEFDAADTDLPLVLLHVTLLPLPPIWLAETILPSQVKQGAQLLASRMTPEVMARGLLVSHPKSDMRLLEDRVLQALDLEVDEDEFVDEEDDRVDSGAEVEPRPSARKSEVHLQRSGRRRWDISVFAANGLMRADTWVVAWEEMERVDVLITPWLDEEEKTLLEDTARRSQNETTQARDEVVQHLESRLRLLEDSAATKQHDSQSLPPAFKPHQVPVERLLRNYLYLQIKDIRNIVILALLLLSTMLGFQVVATRAVTDVSRLDSCEVMGRAIADSLSSKQWTGPQASSTVDTTHKSMALPDEATVILQSASVITAPENGEVLTTSVADVSAEDMGFVDEISEL
ncbi:hypothetical protein ANO11243_087980 [Dothideomycetidae sp. 11243]|nr:hypothetical protein ANO11243_087980 [fungal sp. No.11243]